MKLFYGVLDPRANNPAAQQTNDQLFALCDALGIEVTVAALAARCNLGNIDPQHTGGNANLAAVEVAMNMDIALPEDAVLLTVRGDADSIATMGIIAMRVEGVAISDAAKARIARVADWDKFARGKWAGSKPLPTKDNPWPEGEANREMFAVAAIAEDFNVPVAERVAAVRAWITTGAILTERLEQVNRERSNMISAIETGEIEIDLRGRVVVVISTHKAAISPVGYSFVPVVVAFNPASGQEKVKKFTIAQHEVGYVDLEAVALELNQLEKGWGGIGKVIIGSPQKVSSALTIEQVVAIVEKHLL